MTQLKAQGRSKLPILTPNDIKSRVSVLIYGFPGAGKTYLAGTLLDHPALNPALICVCDHGELTIKDKINPGMFDIMRVASTDDLESVADFLVSSGNKYRSVFIDNITVLHRGILIKSAAKTNANKADRDYEISRNDYGTARNALLAITEAFTNKIPHLNLFVTCLARTVEDEATGSASIEPALSGQLASEIPGYFDVVGYLAMTPPSRKEISAAIAQRKPEPSARYTLTVSQTSQITIARNRGGFLGSVVENPTLPMIYESIHGH